MNDDLIEKVARAICGVVVDADDVDGTWQELIPEARAAITAMELPVDVATREFIDAYALHKELDDKTPFSGNDIRHNVVEAGLKMTRAWSTLTKLMEEKG